MKTKAPQFFKTPGTTCTTTDGCIPENLNL